MRFTCRLALTVAGLSVLAACSSGGKSTDPIAPQRSSTQTGLPTGSSPAASDPTVAPPALTTPVPGLRERTLTFTVVERSPRWWIIETQAGGPPCDAITGLEVTGTRADPQIAVYAGSTTGRPCEAMPAILGTFRLSVDLPT